MGPPLLAGSGVAAHDLKQPLNVIQLTTANLRRRIAPLLDPADAQYLNAKLDRIEEQVERAVALLDGAQDGGAGQQDPAQAGVAQQSHPELPPG